MGQKEDESISIDPMSIGVRPRYKHVLGTAKEFLSDLLDNIRFHDAYNVMGVCADKSFLLQGVHGTGKTMSVVALNNELNQDALKKSKSDPKYKLTVDKLRVVVLPYDVGRYGTAYINVGSKIVQNFFNTAMMIAAGGTPTIVMLDEADALLGARDGMSRSHSEDKKVLETIMKNLQYIHDFDERLYVVIITNSPHLCDEAALRAGRIDKKYEFKLPTFEERSVAFDMVAERINESAGYPVVRTYDGSVLAGLSEGMSYADINSVVESAVKLRVKQLMCEKGKDEVIPAGYVTQKRLERALKEHYDGFNKRVRIGF